MPKIELERCPEDHKPAIAAMFQLYVHDFSEHWAGTDRGELQEDGRFPAYPHLDSYWQGDPRRESFLIRADGHLAGFALVNDFSHSGLPSDYDVAEFFVVRKHRRNGVGRAAALRLIGGRPGQWELAVARANLGALSFWRGVAGALTPEVEELDCDDERWNGVILRFVVA